MATTEGAALAKPDHNSLGKAAFIIGLIGLVMSFVPLVGFVAWLLGPLAILCGAIALRRPPRSLAIAGLITGALTIVVCMWWIQATKSVGEAMNKDTFTPTGQVADTTNAPIMDASVKGLWKEMEDNKVAAGVKYGGHRLRFSNEVIGDFSGDAQTPRIQIVAAEKDYMIYSVSAAFRSEDGPKIAALKKGDKVTFVCEKVSEGFGEGYSLDGCTLAPPA